VTTWLAVAIVAGGCYVLRFGPLLLLSGRQLPDRVARALRVAGPAALAVLVVPAVVPPTSTLDPIAAAPRLVAAAAAVVVYRRRRSVGLTVGTGLLVLGAADVVLST
jgi:branched-subunit amino acid transport protein